MSRVLSIHDLHRRHGPVEAVAGVDLDVEAGEVVALLGPNGAGKTTLTDCVVGLLSPHAGTLSVLGGDPARATIRRRLGVVHQEVGFPTTLRVGEIVAGAAVRVGRPRSEAGAALEEVGLGELVNRRAARLSGGQSRRLQLAMALVSQPRLLVLDEPTEGLDVTARRSFWRMLARRRDDGAGVLLTTHAVAEAAEVADRVVVLRAGRVVATGTPADLTDRAGRRRVRVRTSVDASVVRDWPGVRAAERIHGHLEVSSDLAEDTVRRLFAADAVLDDLTVTRATLADAVAALDPLPDPDTDPDTAPRPGLDLANHTSEDAA